MLCYITSTRECSMSVGNSGRIVIEIEPGLKKELYNSLKKDGMSLKEWFLNHTNDYLLNYEQLDLPLNIENINNKKACTE